MKLEVTEVVRGVEEAALAMRAALHRADRLWRRGGHTPEEIAAMRRAERTAQDSVLRLDIMKETT